MTTIPWEMSKKVRKNFENGLQVRCFGEVAVKADLWFALLEKLGIPNRPQRDAVFKKCLWQHPEKALELRADVIPDDKTSISLIDYFGMKDDFEIFLKETKLGE